MSKVVALKWFKGELQILDQRLLPKQEKWITARSAEAVATAIERLAIRGAPAIGIAAAYGVAVEALRPRANRESLLVAIERLRRTRPTGYNLFWALKRMKAIVERAESVQGAAILREAKSIHAEDAAACSAMAKAGLTLLSESENVLTYCNTGALATGGIGTALGVIREGYKSKKIREVFACETRPVGQGARLTVWECVKERIPVTLICDNMVASLMNSGKVQRVFVGADRIARNGDTSNKIGTLGVATAASNFGIPFHVVAPTSTFDYTLESGTEIQIEERDANEVMRCTPGLKSLKRAKVWNPAFDVTPAHMIHSIITEHGVHMPPFRFTD